MTLQGFAGNLSGGRNTTVRGAQLVEAHVLLEQPAAGGDSRFHRVEAVGCPGSGPNFFMAIQLWTLLCTCSNITCYCTWYNRYGYTVFAYFRMFTTSSPKVSRRAAAQLESTILVLCRWYSGRLGFCPHRCSPESPGYPPSLAVLEPVTSHTCQSRGLA